MKKIALSLLALTLAAAPAFSQKKMISKANTALIPPADLTEAKKAIEAAMGHEETSANPFTFVVAGKVYKAIYDAELKKRMLGQAYDSKVIYENLVNATNCYTNAAELEQVPDAKGKTTNKWDKEIKKAYKTLQDPLLTEGYAAHKANDLDNAFKLYEAYISIPRSSIMNEEPVDSSYYLAEYLAVNVALQKKENAKAIKYMFELKDADKFDKGNQVYVWLVDALQAEGDTAKSLKVLEQGLKKYPTDTYMIAKQVNYYIDRGQRDKAINYLDDAIKANPNSAQFYVVKADLYRIDKKYDEAIAIYEKALSVDPKSVDALNNIGGAYASKGQDADAAASALKSDAAFKKAKNENTKLFEKALGYLEQAKALYTTPNIDNVNRLIVVYNRLGKGPELQEMLKLKKSL